MHEDYDRFSVAVTARLDWTSRLAHHLQHAVDDLKETAALHVVIVHQVNQAVSAGDGLYHLTRLGAGRVDLTPVSAPEGKGLIL